MVQLECTNLKKIMTHAAKDLAGSKEFTDEGKSWEYRQR